MDAIEKFRPELGHRFEAYGTRRIRGAMSDGMRSVAWLPRGAETRASRVIEKVVPVDFQGATSEGGQPLAESLPDPSATSWLADLELEADYREVKRAVASLPDRERKVITDYYFGRRLLQEIADELGVTQSRVCQLHRRGLRMLEAVLAERLSA